MPKFKEIKKTSYQLPLYLPDATRAVVKGLDSSDLTAVGTEGVVVNTFHLMTDPGTEVLRSMGGVKRLMNFRGLVVSDSGGWQVFSLIHRNKKKGKIGDSGVEFYLEGSKKQLFTPEKSLQVQFALGSDLMICLDDFTPPDATKKDAARTVERTVNWAKRAKREFEKQLSEGSYTEDERPLLMAVVQGGYEKDLRRECFERLEEIGFDAYGYGGYVVDEEGELDLELSKFLADLISQDKLKFALGMGRPWDVAMLSEMGWDIFDCTLPTRDARHRRLYTFKEKPRSLKDLQDRNNYSYIYINKKIYQEDQDPVSILCDCPVCRHFSRAYLRHLFKIGDLSAYRLATIHNLYFYNNLIKLLREFLLSG